MIQSEGCEPYFGTRWDLPRAHEIDSVCFNEHKLNPHTCSTPFNAQKLNPILVQLVDKKERPVETELTASSASASSSWILRRVRPSVPVAQQQPPQRPHPQLPAAVPRSDRRTVGPEGQFGTPRSQPEMAGARARIKTRWLPAILAFCC